MLLLIVTIFLIGLFRLYNHYVLNRRCHSNSDQHPHQLHQVVTVTFDVDDAEGSELVVISTTIRKYVINSPNSCSHNQS